MAKARSKRGAEVEVEDTREKRKARTQPASSVPAVASGVSGESEGAPNGDLEEPAVVAQSTTPETPPEAVTRTSRDSIGPIVPRTFNADAFLPQDGYQPALGENAIGSGPTCSELLPLWTPLILGGVAYELIGSA